MYPETSRLTRYIKPLAEQMASHKELAELKELVRSKANVFERSTQGVKQALETIEINNQWKTNNYQEMSRYLTKINYKDLHNLDEISLI